MIHETTGMLSYGAISLSHPGQCDGGFTTDSLRGMRQITTFRKEPMRRPNSPQMAAIAPVTPRRVRGGSGTDADGRARVDLVDLRHQRLDLELPCPTEGDRQRVRRVVPRPELDERHRDRRDVLRRVAQRQVELQHVREEP